MTNASAVRLEVLQAMTINDLRHLVKIFGAKCGKYDSKLDLIYLASMLMVK